MSNWQNWLHEGLIEFVPILISALLHHLTKHSQLVLIDGNQMAVGEDLLRFRADGAQIVAHVERRRPDAPERHLGPLLGPTEAKVSDNQLIGVKPVAGSCQLSG